MLDEQLKNNIGFSEKETKTYLALLELGEATIAEIAKKSKLKRTTVYLVIESLKEKGFVNSLKKGKKQYFYAEDPRSIGKKIEEKKNMFDSIVPELLAMSNFLDKKPKITFYEGSEGIKTVYRDFLNYKKQEILAWVSEEAFETLGKDFIDYYVPQRVKNKIWVKAIAPDTPEIREYKKVEGESLRQTRIIDAQKFPIKVEIDLYGKNKIGIVSFKENMGLIIESETLHTTLKSIFMMSWESLEM